MMSQALGIWDVVSHPIFHEGQVVEILGDKADVYFLSQRRIIRILQTALLFLRHGNPKEFLPPSKRPTGGPRKHPPEDGKALLVAQIAKGKKLIPKLGTSYEKLVNDLIGVVGSNWYFTRSFHGQVSSHATGRMRNCLWVGLNIEKKHIDIGIPHASELPEKHHEKFIFEARGYHGHDMYGRWLETGDLPELKRYREALFDVIAFAKNGHL